MCYCDSSEKDYREKCQCLFSTQNFYQHADMWEMQPLCKKNNLLNLENIVMLICELLMRPGLLVSLHFNLNIQSSSNLLKI